jgi:uncharacterized protein DUF4365
MVSSVLERLTGRQSEYAVGPDDIGDRGQWLFCLLMTQIYPGRNDPYSRPRFLGDKHPTFDYLVELVGSEAYFFFVQVKSTRQGYRQGRGARRLRVNVDREDVRRMVASPVPAYVVGIDEPQRAGYILSINEPRRAGLGGLPARHLLNADNLPRLWQEVRDFWASRNMVLVGSHFV